MKYIVGRPKIKTAFTYVLFICAFGVSIFIADAWEGMQIVGILIILVGILIVFPGISYCELMWKVDQNVLQYTYHDNMLMKISSFFKHLLHTHRLEYQMTIELSQIDYIAITYAKVPRLPYGAIGYDVWFHVHMYDGSIYSFIALTLSGRKDFNQAVDFMKEQGIHFKDGYHILDALHSHEHLSYYLERIDKGQSK